MPVFHAWMDEVGGGLEVEIDDGWHVSCPGWLALVVIAIVRTHSDASLKLGWRRWVEVDKGWHVSLTPLVGYG